jgi:thiosulfate/3-mercaptopyruvate sulfurtransferase
VIDPIVTPEWLAQRLAAAPSPLEASTADGRPLRIVDCRYYLDGRSGQEAHRAGHLPGAVWIDLERWLSTAGAATDGRHPLPSPDTFAEGMRRHGVGDGTVTVVYDDQAGLVAGRMVWMLRRTGHDAALLDGGLAAWPGRLETDDVVPPAATFSAAPWPAQHFSTTEEVRDRPAGTRLIDARAAERYRGDTEPIDRQAGHIPGAENLPLSGNLGADGRFRPLAALAERYADLRDQAVIAYCGSGVSACHDLLALEAVGQLGRLYVGSWSAWSSHPDLPVSTGDAP